MSSLSSLLCTSPVVFSLLLSSSNINSDYDDDTRGLQQADEAPRNLDLYNLPSVQVRWRSCLINHNGYKLQQITTSGLLLLLFTNDEQRRTYMANIDIDAELMATEAWQKADNRVMDLISTGCYVHWSLIFSLTWLVVPQIAECESVGAAAGPGSVRWAWLCICIVVVLWFVFINKLDHAYCELRVAWHRKCGRLPAGDEITLWWAFSTSAVSTGKKFLAYPDVSLHHRTAFVVIFIVATFWMCVLLAWIVWTDLTCKHPHARTLLQPSKPPHAHIAR